MSRVDVAVDVAVDVVVDVTVDVTVDVAVDVERLPLSRASRTSPKEMKGYSMEAVGRRGEDRNPFYKARTIVSVESRFIAFVPPRRRTSSCGSMIHSITDLVAAFFPPNTY
jgi:Flp pilus assembly CpaF family ATPase